MNKNSFYRAFNSASFLLISTTVQVSYAQKTNSELSEIVVEESSDTQLNKHTSNGNYSYLSNSNSLITTSLKSQKSHSIGETVSKVSGIQNNSFGPSNGLPQIRSLTNNRISVHENGISDSGIAGMTGQMPTPITPNNAESIEIYKSSAAVLYGGNAIGGAINVKNSHLPSSLPKKPISGNIEISTGINTANTQIFGLNGTTNNVVWHIDGLHSKVSDYKIGGNNSKSSECYKLNNFYRMGAVGMGQNDGLARACQVDMQFSEGRFNIKSRQYVDAKYLKHLQNGTEQEYLDKVGMSTAETRDIYKKYIPNWAKIWVKQPDGSWKQTIDPSKFALNPAYKDGEQDEIKDLIGVKDITETKKGKITNSHMERSNISLGASYVGDNGYIGVGLSHFTTDYGVPGYASLNTRTKGTKNSYKPVNIKNSQKKVSIEGAYEPAIEAIDSVKLLISHANTTNEEYLGNIFADSINAKQQQARVEVMHNLGQNFSGTVGIEAKRRAISGVGADRFMPDSKSKQYGIFALQNYTNESVSIGTGIRIEHVKQKAIYNGSYEANKGDKDLSTRFKKNTADFKLKDYFIDAEWSPTDMISFNARYSHSERAPDVNELFSSNRHFANFQLEYGDPDLKKEIAKTWEIGSELNWKNTTLKINYFNTRYDDYIYLGETGFADGLSLNKKEWRQSDTLIKGWEIDLNQQIKTNNGDWDFRIFADLVKNSPKGNNQRKKYNGNYMENMPTSRYGASIGWTNKKWTAGLSTVYHSKQKHTTGKTWEAQLPSYQTVDAYIGYTYKPTFGGEAELFINAKNLTDVKAHANNSTLKYITPIVGRSINAGLRYKF
ncbi:MAG: TonB-dependent receptor [Gammaproteobacteria bacterium]|nr:TonB-dependent receptor [Gammaproteobacteria bacterium]